MKKFLFITIIALVALFGMSADLYAATAKIDSTDYATLSEAITAAGNTETTITLIDDEAPVERIKIPTGANITLDLNGKTLTLPSPEDNYGLVVAGNLTITGEGTINAGMYGIGVTGNLVIEGGTYNCEAGDYLIGSWGTVTIKDGTFNGNYCIANGFNGGTVEILDGEFSTNEETIVLGGAVVKGGTYNQIITEEYVASNAEFTIKLDEDVTLTERLKVPAGANVTLDLNGKTLTLPSPEDTYGLVVAGDLTITGEGTVNAGMYGIGVTGNLVIENGTYNCEEGDYLIGSWGTVTIKDGTFNGNYCIANGFNGGTVEILDGEFTTNEETIVLGGTVVKGGTFSHDVDEYVDTTLDAVKDEKTGKYYVGTLNKVNVKETENGKVEVSLTEAIVEQVVEVKATANEGYKVKAIIVKDASGKEVEVVDGTFLMPDSEVTVEVTFEKVEAVKGELDDTPATGTMDKILVVSAIVAGAAVIAIAKKKQAMKNLI